MEVGCTSADEHSLLEQAQKAAAGSQKRCKH